MSVAARISFITVVLLVHLQYVRANEVAKEQELAQNISTCVDLYEKGAEAYLENRFDDCVLNFNEALKVYQKYANTLLNCRLRCRQDADLSDPLYPIDVENLRFFENILKTTLCIVKCKTEHKDIFGPFNINPQIEKSFKDLKPYEYLHICYFQPETKFYCSKSCVEFTTIVKRAINYDLFNENIDDLPSANNREIDVFSLGLTKQFQKAASAVFTYLVLHPDDKIMSASLKHYSKLEGVNMKEIINFEAKDYVYLYVYGAQAYDLKDWDNVINNMEESLLSYLQSDEECRALCEGPFDQGWYPDFVPAIANHFTYCLRCKQNCRKKLDHLNGEKYDDLLPSHYHYLQYAYYKKGNLKAACEAVASYLLFYPNDKDMLNNKNFYEKLPKVDEHFFTPRPEALNYFQRQSYENKLMKFILQEFKFYEEVKETEPEDLFRVVLTEKQLKGENRFVADGLATNKQCKKILEIAHMFAITGDGYDGKKSPHTIMEKFEGVTMSRAASLVYFGLLDPQYLKLYLKITEDAKTKVEEYFHLDKVLFITYTHLVCRSALPDSPKNRTDFSHKIHADNCNIFEDGRCEKSPPAYTWRDYTAIVYLNNDFDGGEFVFSADPKGTFLESTIIPQCGRMIAFSAGAENLHGVKAVRRGARCALGVWLTFEETQQEIDRALAYAVISK